MNKRKTNDIMNSHKILKTVVFLLLFYVPSSVMGEEPHPGKEMQIFLGSSALLNEGIAGHDKNSLADAAEGYGAISVKELSPNDFEVITVKGASPMNPEVQYNKEFCDVIRKNEFIIVEREPLAVIRDVDLFSAINTVSRSISPASELTFTFTGAGNMEVAVPSYPSDNLLVTLQSEGEVIPVSKTENGSFYSSWNIGNPSGASFSVTIANQGEVPVSFAIALQ